MVEVVEDMVILLKEEIHIIMVVEVVEDGLVKVEMGIINLVVAVEDMEMEDLVEVLKQMADLVLEVVVGAQQLASMEVVVVGFA